jgi:uncharacterized membrane protein YfcA
VVPVDWITVGVLAVLFLATLIRSAFGFGEALVAVPLLAFLMPVEAATPVAVLASVTVAAVVLVQDWRHVQFRSAGRLLLTTLVGTPLGLWLLTAVPGPVVRAVLAAVLILFSGYSLLHPRLVELTNDRWAWAFGFVAGVLGGAYGMNGPPLVVYGALRGWSPQTFRATLQGYFFPASLMALGGYWLTGLWTPVVTRHFLVALPAIVVAILLGRIVNRRLAGPAFLRYVHIGLIVIGLMLLGHSLAG